MAEDLIGQVEDSALIETNRSFSPPAKRAAMKGSVGRQQLGTPCLLKGQSRRDSKESRMMTPDDVVGVATYTVNIFSTKWHVRARMR